MLLATYGTLLSTIVFAITAMVNGEVTSHIPERRFALEISSTYGAPGESLAFLGSVAFGPAPHASFEHV